ncbi:Atu2307/SP_0267 family LLM class monooxygenase [Arthrobacter sp. ISL-28]|uniref:Atu2307/SP_0267 family LLM class monooxygenase n=1 Tax=Arthrobacter sp. ISL-28 TaxID=2819108 RepID=UPI002036534D|nr:Atu2307/SP_0267 family LLM class monooxygenase [Arthrobacter sp. ISL-28]
MELGVYSFAEAVADPNTGRRISPQERLKDLVEEIELADQVGLDVYGLGEHHREDFAAASPAVVLAAAAARTGKIRLTSAVTVLSSSDPVRVHQDFATLDLLSGGRAEIMAGRGSFTESFPLFGYDLSDYDTLFEEKLDLLLKIRANERVTWSGRHRAPLSGQGVYPRPAQDQLPLWVGVGGSPSSAIRAGKLGLPLSLGIIAGDVRRLAPLVDLYRSSALEAGHPESAVKISINAHGYVADSKEQAIDLSYPYFQSGMSAFLNAPFSALPTKQHYGLGTSLQGALVAGSPEDVAEKILFQQSVFGNERFLMQISVGTMPHREVMRSIELLGTRVAPIVRAESLASAA